ncbi:MULTISPECIES: oxygenase MpaB family protein [Acidithrix]|uniref:ER-bound oxygenase mpaB/mpaB'/Rubber oxygenase catalytic domain-containing protein n=1 Tax=Acidithrix ferrooxidans TaxID=1280514 RepID=A0A0D8HJR1_9ACTN|nr:MULTISPECIES: oxygenase MpaB family protein [Acidithrix]KJF18188.1 hypothetical protein AXFE_09340 [Acidithrix ferrooxidans]CAG4899978.1 unnamed protein product [Acidithrix sp. C25]
MDRYSISKSDSLGIMGPESISWRIHADPTSFIGGIRALLVQALSIPSMAAVAGYSNYRSDPWGRLARTSNFVMTTTFGSKSQAWDEIEGVKAIHRRVVGVDPESGISYRADDPILLAFIHNCFVDSMLTSYCFFVHELSFEEKNLYLQEQSVIAFGLGASPSKVVLNVSDLGDAIANAPYIGISNGARQAFDDLVKPQFPDGAGVLSVLWPLIADSALDLLPAFAKEHYGINRSQVVSILRRKVVWALGIFLRLYLPGHPMYRQAKLQWYDDLRSARRSPAR